MTIINRATEVLYVSKAIQHFGVQSQIAKIREECRELIDAIYENDQAHIAEEIADVLNMIKQAMIIYNIADEQVNSIRMFKMNRTLDIIHDKYEPFSYKLEHSSEHL